MNKISFYIVCFLGFCYGLASAQPQSIILEGRVENSSGVGGLNQVIVINQRTSKGILAGSGIFTLQALKNDTILINAQGFIVRKICFSDSVYRPEYIECIKLDSLHFELKEVEVYPHKNLNEINEEEKKLGVIPNTDINKTVHPIDFAALALQIDIDYIWERLSHNERQKRAVASLEDDELRRTILKDLLYLYNKSEIVNMSEDQLDKFIDYCNFNDKFILKSTEYELAQTVKAKLEQYRKTHAGAAP